MCKISEIHIEAISVRYKYAKSKVLGASNSLVAARTINISYANCDIYNSSTLDANYQVIYPTGNSNEL